MAQEGKIYLTFDDGPLTGTENILNVLQAESVPAPKDQ
ncbi:polysaccharide deacetylase family protein [Mesorhizobium sp. SB112]